VSLRYLLDTNVLSEVIRRPRGRVAGRIVDVGEEAICTSIVVAAELRYGAEKSGSEALAERVDLVLSALEVLPLEAPAERRYGVIRHHLTGLGKLIGPNDLLIAAYALAANLTLVTANTREFECVPGLRVENWLAE